MAVHRQQIVDVRKDNIVCRQARRAVSDVAPGGGAGLFRRRSPGENGSNKQSPDRGDSEDY